MKSFAREKLISIISLNFFSLVICSSISQKFHEFNIVPEIITSSPKELLNVTYPGNIQVMLGNSIPPSAASTPPALKWNADPKRFYLLTMIDADLPPPAPQFFHWVVGNIPGDDLTEGKLLASYVTPMPPPGDGPHRYIFLIFEQPKKLGYKINLFLLGQRKYPSLRNVLKFYGINEAPLAGNFFISQKK